MKFLTEQEAFWAGSFGSEYIQRNQGAALLASNLDFFSKALSKADGISGIEFGANIDMNLQAIKFLYPEIDLHAIELNAEAAEELSTLVPSSQVPKGSILGFTSTKQWDLPSSRAFSSISIQKRFHRYTTSCFPPVGDTC